MISPERVERLYWPDGTLEYEGPFVNDLLHGTVRRWFPNGQIEFEIPMAQGLKHGECKFWNQEGKLLGSFHVNMGTGVYKQWYPNGTLKLQVFELNDNFHGPFYMWLPDGTIDFISFYIDGKKVTKKKYIEACKENPDLPELDSATMASNDPIELSVASWRTRQEERKASKATPEESLSLIEFDEMIRRRSSKEALKWLKEASPPERYLGKFDSVNDSIEFIEEGYAAGIKRIYAIDIKLTKDGECETSRNLVLELPKSKRKRATAFEWIVQTCEQHSGNDPPDDDGQPYVYIFLD